MRNADSFPMDILILGTGAIGSYLGAKLARGKHRVVFLERPQRVQVLREKGITVTRKGEAFTLTHPHVVGSLPEAFRKGPFDVALFTLKSYHTAEMTSKLKSFRVQVPPILCLQNGVGNQKILEKTFGKMKAVAGTVTSSVFRHGPGEITVRKERGTGIGAGNPLSKPLYDAFQKAGLKPWLYEQPQDMKWTKLLTNMMGNASCAILDMPPGDIYAHRDLYELEIRQLREALAVMNSQGHQPVKLPGIPSKLLAWVIGTWPIPLSHPFLSQAIKRGRGGKMPSLHMDLHQGKENNEVEVLNGAVVRAGEESGIPTPVNTYFYWTLRKLVSGRLPPGTFAQQPGRFIKEFRQSAGAQRSI
ncbi:MAG: ketopantoate reductase family protein [Anaerolineales bacterium]